MKNKISVLLNVSFLFEADENELNEDFNNYDKLQNEIIKKVEEIGKDYNLKWESSQQIVLDEKNMNCGHCVNCGCWVTDLDKEATISGLNRGAIHNGKLLCDECLPKDHKHAF